MSNPDDLIGHTDRPIDDDSMFGEDEGVLDNVDETGEQGNGTTEPETLEVSPDSLEISEEDMPPTDPGLPLSLYVEDNTLEVEHIIEWDGSTIEEVLVFQPSEFELKFDYGDTGETTRWLTVRYSLQIDSLAEGVYSVNAEGTEGEFTVEASTEAE